MTDSGQYVRTYYGVPAQEGMDIVLDGTPARIVGFDGARLKVRIEGRNGVHVAHPTWEIEYPNTTEGDDHDPA